jgi:hypothetical protein
MMRYEVATLPKPVVVAGSRATTVAIGGAAAAFFTLFAVVNANRSAAFDLAVTLRLQRYKSTALARFMAAASWPGFPPQGRVIPPAIIGLWFLAGRPAEAMSQTAAWVAAALSTGLKFLARRPRPLPPRGGDRRAPRRHEFPERACPYLRRFLWILGSSRLGRGPRSAPAVDHRRVPSRPRRPRRPEPDRTRPPLGDRCRGLLPDGAGLSPWPRPITSPATMAMGMTRSTHVVWNSNAGSKAGLRTNRSSWEELRQILAANGIVAELFVGDNPEESRSRVRSAVKDGSRVRVERSWPGPNSGSRWHHLRRVGMRMAPSWGELLPVDGGRCLPTIGDLGIDVLARRNRARER